MKKSPSKDKIIKAAVNSYEKLGYEASSARLVAKSYKGAPGSIYYYFESMEDLYLKAMQKYLPQAFLKILKKGEPLFLEIQKSFSEKKSDTKKIHTLFEESLHQILKVLTQSEKTALKMCFKEKLRIGQNNPARAFMLQIMDQFITRLCEALIKGNDKSAETLVSALFDSCCISFFNKQKITGKNATAEFRLADSLSEDNEAENEESSAAVTVSSSKIKSEKKDAEKPVKNAEVYKIKKTISDELL